MLPMARGTPGPDKKGDRAQHTLRVNRPYLGIYRAAAERAGLSLNDYLEAVLAQAHQLDEPPYLSRNRDQPPLLAG